MGNLTIWGHVKSGVVPILLHVTGVGGIFWGELRKNKVKREKVGESRNW